MDLSSTTICGQWNGGKIDVENVGKLKFSFNFYLNFRFSLFDLICGEKREENK